MPALIALFVIVLAVVIRNIVIVPQASSYVVERMGIYSATWGAGLHFKVPFIERVAKKVSLKEQVVDFKPQPVITRDNVTMQIDTVVFFQVTTPSCTPMAWTAPSLPLRTCAPPPCATSSARWSWTTPSPAGT